MTELNSLNHEYWPERLGTCSARQSRPCPALLVSDSAASQPGRGLTLLLAVKLRNQTAICQSCRAEQLRASQLKRACGGSEGQECNKVLDTR